MSAPPLPETLAELVRRYSPSGQEAGAVGYLVTRMAELSFTKAFADEAGNAVGVMGGGPRQIILLGHIDTVPGEIPVRQEDNILYGRGTVDAKGPLSAFVDAVAAVGAVEGWQFVVIGAVGEEQDSPGAQYIAPRYQPELAIIGEPSGWDRVTLGYKGSAWAELTVRSPMAHTAGQGESACETAVKIWLAIQEWASAYNAGRERYFDQVTPTLRGMASGEGNFESWATMRVGARLPLDLPPRDWYAALREIQPGMELEETGFAIPAYRSDKTNPLVRAFLSGIRTIQGQPGFVLKTGTADINIVGPVWGCPAVAYGPGDSSLDHTPNEHIDIAEYCRAVEVLKAVLRKLSRAE